MANEGASRRLGKREQALLRARIIDQAGHVTDVWIRDLSSTGVRLETLPFADVPRRFLLRFHKNGNREAEAEIVWRRGVDLGARFVTETEAAPPPRPDAGVHVKKMPLDQLRSIAQRGRS